MSFHIPERTTQTHNQRQNHNLQDFMIRSELLVEGERKAEQGPGVPVLPEDILGVQVEGEHRFQDMQEQQRRLSLQQHGSAFQYCGPGAHSRRSPSLPPSLLL